VGTNESNEQRPKAPHMKEKKNGGEAKLVGYFIYFFCDEEMSV